jgi:plasmid stability protein
MAATLTLKNVPDEVYQRLKRSAERHRRSLNSEAIVRLEQALGTGGIDPAERLERIRALRAELAPHRFDPAEIDRLKRQGRP